MKRFTLWTLALLVSIVAFAQKPKEFLTDKLRKTLPTEQVMSTNQIKMAPASLKNKFKKGAAANG